MGTTGGDRQKLYKMVKDAKVYAVIPPKQDHNKIIFPYDFQEMKSVFHETKGQVRWIQSKWEEEHKAWLKYVEQELAKKRGKSIDATDQIENDLKSAEDELYVIPEHLKIWCMSISDPVEVQGPV